MSFYQNDIEFVVTQFTNKVLATDRYASFDYCYAYFKNTSSAELRADMEKSCLVLGFYLASWGMMRGSSFLLSHSAKYFEPLIDYIASLDRCIWDIDIDQYSDTNICLILDIYNHCKDILIQAKNSHLTLVTKILLGVFGFVPAFDRYFCDTFRLLAGDSCRYRSLNKSALNSLHLFYLDNQNVVDRLANNITTIDFKTGELSELTYPKAKIIDMYGFTRAFGS